jgi:DNA polymerase-3 subunit beta
MEVSGKSLKIVATDGRRLAYIKKELEERAPADIKVNIPSKTIHELSKLLGEEGMVKILLVKNQIVFDFGKTFLISRLIEGHFPNYEQVIPKEEKTVVRILKEEWLQAVKRASLLTSQESQAVKLEIGKGKVALSARAPNIGEAREEIKAEIKGEDMMVGFNPAYLMDVLRNLGESTVQLTLSGSDRPGVIRTGEDYCYVIMPMQLTV